MKTKYKIFFAKIIYNFLKIFFKKDLICRRNNINWSLNLSEAIDLHLFIFGSFEKEIVNCLKKIDDGQFRVGLDIGANFGVQSLQLINELKYTKIYSIEPTTYAFNKMKKNLSLNPELSEKIITDQILIDLESRRTINDIYSSWNLDSDEKKHHKHMGIKMKIDDAKICSLDSFLNLKKIKNVDFIKLDVDGSELFIFKSGENFFKKYKPPIIMELAPYIYPEFGYSVRELINYIKNLNYKFYNIKNLKPIDNIDIYISKIKDGSSVNILLR